mgnify:CR=1 FL=1
MAFSNYNPHSIVINFPFITPVLVPMLVTNNSQHITHKQLITLPFITPFSSLELINVDKSTHHQVSLPPNTYYKEIHEFHTLNKGLEIHLPQIVEQSLWDLSLPLSLGTKSIQYIQTNYHNKILKLNKLPAN